MTGLLVIALSQVSTDSGAAVGALPNGAGSSATEALDAAHGDASPADQTAQLRSALTGAGGAGSVRPCPSARKAVRYYAGRIAFWRDKMGAGSDSSPKSVASPSGACPRYLAHVLQRKARAARAAYERWHREQYQWWRWMPDKFQRVGACETGYGTRPGRFDWDSGTYVSFAGIYRPAYAQFARYLGLPTWDDPGRRTPREQYRVAAAIQARYGWGAWGCGSA